MPDDLKPFTCRRLPAELAPLNELALDVRWTWNHGADELWRMLDAETWEITRNPWWILQSVSQDKLEQQIHSRSFQKELERLLEARRDYISQPGWYQQTYPQAEQTRIAYFCMEFGLGEAIPLYAGGLGVLAGDFLKTASDLNVPVVGVGLLYQQGYFRQILAHDGTQGSVNPPNDPICLPLQPVTDAHGGWLRVPLELPGRELLLRAWKVKVGRVTLFLLDSNDPVNDPADRGIVYKLYEDQPDLRLMQEMVLGIGGWKLLELLGIRPEVCHLNEGHTAFAVLERARSFMEEAGVTFPVALWATRGGNVFTTHTAVAASFDRFPGLIERYFTSYAESAGISMEQLLALGRRIPDDPAEPFDMATLAMHGCTSVNGVSRLHGQVSREIFQSLFPRWPQGEVPVKHVTNGVHMPSWDSQMADRLWTESVGNECWCRDPAHIASAMVHPTDGELWALRCAERQELVNYARKRGEYLSRQGGRGCAEG